MDELKQYIREVPDFPKPGILFYDITTLLGHPDGLKRTLDAFTDRFRTMTIDKVVGIESRGFLFGPHLAYQLGVGFTPVRKSGKLPANTVSERYELEYGSDELEMHSDAIVAGERVLIVDDLVATGGTAVATTKLVSSLGAEVVALGFVIELTFLDGRSKLDGHRVESLIRY